MKNTIGVSTNSYHGFSLDEAIAGISAAGYKYVELTSIKGWTEHIAAGMSDLEKDEAKRKIGDFGLQPFGLSGHCNIMEIEGLKDFEANIELAAEFGCKYILTATGKMRSNENEASRDAALIDNLNSLMPKCEQYGMELVLEILDEHDTGEKLRQIVSKVSSDNIGIAYDTANVVLYGRVMPEDDIKTCADYVKYVHLKDKTGAMDEWRFPAVGSGTLKLLEIMDYLAGNGYGGPYCVEIEYTEEFTMRNKVAGDIDIANKGVADSFNYLKVNGRII